MEVRRAKSVIGDKIGDDIILINTKTGAYYSVTPEAGAVWLAIGQGSAVVDPDAIKVAEVLVREGILESEFIPDDPSPVDDSIAFLKFTDMSDILLADPIHEVDEDGWPRIR